MANVLVWFAAALVFVITSCQDIPAVALNGLSCPVGPGVNRGTILIGTQATCECVRTRAGDNSTQARWYTQDNKTVGVEDAEDGSSVLNVTYNPSDPNQSYKCLPYTTSNVTLKGVTYTPEFRCSYQVLEKRSAANISCPVPSNVRSITWQLLSGNTITNVSTCDLVTKNCTDLMNGSYHGVFPESSNGSMATLFVESAKVDETRFAIVADNGVSLGTIELEVYAWPTQLQCSYQQLSTYVSFWCQVNNVYPDISFSFLRKEHPIDPTYVEIEPRECYLDRPGSGSDGDHFAMCKWRLQFQGLMLKNTFYARLYIPVSDISQTRNKIIQFGELKSTLNVTEVELSKTNCAGVNGEAIARGITATCRCGVKARVYPQGFARWFTQDNVQVGQEDKSDLSSTLTFSYNAAVPNQTYYCRPVIPIQAPSKDVPFKPKFSSSAPSLNNAELTSLIFITGVVLSGIISRYA